MSADTFPAGMSRIDRIAAILVGALERYDAAEKLAELDAAPIGEPSEVATEQPSETSP